MFQYGVQRAGLLPPLPPHTHTHTNTHTHTHTHARKRTRTNAHTTHTCVHTQTHTHTPRTHTTHTRARVSHISAHVDKTKKNLRVIETRVGNFYMLQDHLTLQYSSTLERSIWDWICSVILEGSFNNIATSVYDELTLTVFKKCRINPSSQ